MSAKIRDYYAEEVDFLRESGSGDSRILLALGVSASTLARALYREGRHDIAAPFEAIAKAERRRRVGQSHPATCVDCATDINWGCTRCRSCELARRRRSAA